MTGQVPEQFFFSSLLGVIVMFFMAIGLRGLILRRPFVVSSHLLVAVAAACFLPEIAVLVMAFNGGTFPIARGVGALVVIAILVLMSVFARGYLVFGARPPLVREALLRGLQVQGIVFEEVGPQTQSRLPGAPVVLSMRLPSHEGEIRVRYSSGKSGVLLQARGGQSRTVLEAVVPEMESYFQSNASGAIESMATFGLYVVMAAIFAVVIVSLPVKLASRSACSLRHPAVSGVPAQIRQPKATQVFREQYLAKGPHKAFAVSPAGAYGYCYSMSTVQEAKECALAYCNKYRRRGQGECAVVSVDASSMPGGTSEAEQWMEVVH